MKPHVILVDKDDNPIGTAEKLTAHRTGQLHRAFSVFIYRYNNPTLELLLQQRHPQKYHCGGLWTNTCCSHPLPDETIHSAATRRLQEEMGINVELTEMGKFTYYADCGNGLFEHEIDHVLTGELRQQNFVVNVEEVADYDWITPEKLRQAIEAHPERYTPWLREVLAMVDLKK